MLWTGPELTESVRAALSAYPGHVTCHLAALVEVVGRRLYESQSKFGFFFKKHGSNR